MIGKVIIAAMAALFAVSARHLYEAWIKHLAWSGLSIEPERTAANGLWAIRVHNNSSIPIKNCTAYLTINHDGTDHAPGVFLDYASDPTTPDFVTPIIQQTMTINEDCVAWARQQGPKREHSPTLDIYPGERQALHLVALAEIPTYNCLQQLRHQCNVLNGKLVIPRGIAADFGFEEITVLVFPSETGFTPNPRAFLKAERSYAAKLKLVSETLPAKEFELLIDPKSPDALVRCVRVLPKGGYGWIERLERDSAVRPY